jgi:AAA15 family ATPase/GTPase
MSTENIEKNERKTIHLNNFYLDPNNYRFVDNNKYEPIPDDKIIDTTVQRQTRKFIEGKNRDGVKTLLNSFKANGFLDVDIIQVKRLENNKYLVLEGNRRITALKILKEEYENNDRDRMVLGKLNPEIFKKVPTAIYTDDENHLIIMGLKHISGPKMWPAINQAQLIYDYLKPYFGKKEYEVKEQELMESLSIGRQKLRGSQRAYHFILDYKNSDYGDQFKSEMFSVFEEVVKKPRIKTWLGWNDKSYKAENRTNVERFFGWISEIDDSLSEKNGVESSFTEPLISKSIEIRSLDKIIEDETALEMLEKTRDFSITLASSLDLEKITYEKSIYELNKNITTLAHSKSLIEDEDIEKLKKMYHLFSEILPETTSLDVQVDNVSVCFEKGRISHFSELTIESYKVFKDFKLDNLNRINIFAGFNNTGKTTLLEAVYLLTKQNNMSAFFEMIKLKNKLESLSTTYLNDYFDEDIKMSAIFSNTPTEIIIQKYEAKDIDKKNDYLASYKILATIDDVEITNIAHTFENNPLQRYYEKIEILCNSIFKSPYFYNRNEIVNTHYKNVKLKVFDMVIEFISEYIDGQIEDIELTEKNDIKRFLVDSKAFPEKSVDITSYGEGLQRIFEIALSFAYCKNGVLLIDELETAIHYSLLVDFSKFIQELAVKFNVQVFITTHSKECIGAFVENGVHNKDINFYTMLRGEDNQIETITYNDEALINELEQDLEVRGW